MDTTRKKFIVTIGVLVLLTVLAFLYYRSSSRSASSGHPEFKISPETQNAMTDTRLRMEALLEANDLGKEQDALELSSGAALKGVSEIKKESGKRMPANAGASIIPGGVHDFNPR